MKTKILYGILGALVIAGVTFVETYGFISLINDKAPINNIIGEMAVSLTVSWVAIAFIGVVFSNCIGKLKDEIDKLKKQNK